VYADDEVRNQKGVPPMIKMPPTGPLNKESNMSTKQTVPATQYRDHWDLDDIVTDDINGNEPCPIVGIVVALHTVVKACDCCYGWHLTHVVVHSPYVGRVELKPEDIRYYNGGAKPNKPVKPAPAVKAKPVKAAK
jgi:hypothetical protein